VSLIASLRSRVASRHLAAGLFLCHAPCDRVLAHYARLRTETAGLVDWALVIDQGHLDPPPDGASFPHPAIVMPHRFATARALGRLTAGAGMMDTVIMPRVLAAPHEFVWALEYDVDYSGTWSDLFARFARNRADVLTTTLTSRPLCPDWCLWPTVQAPAELPQAKWCRSFNPILRLSRRFAAAYVAAVESGPWQGHYEFTIPTIARHLGFHIEDLARPRPHLPGAMLRRAVPRRFSPPTYHNTPTDPNLSPGTFIFRPARSAYFHERPADFPVAGRLYHPIKPA
jgi:hypothetical protein